MKYRAIFFDLDGTLLPMDQDTFTKGYFSELVKIVAPFGLSAEETVSAVWSGTKAMVTNTGNDKNEKVFWDTFEKITNMSAKDIKPACNKFYSNEFNLAKAYTDENQQAVEAVEIAREKTKRVVLASNPVFPLDGQLSRLGWVGLCEDDFDYITSYENCRLCKPNPTYYKELCDELGVSPKECLMIGNDEREDMYAASMAGMDCYLVTDCKIPFDVKPWHGKHGNFSEMLDFLRSL